MPRDDAPPSLRLFVAVELPDSTKRELTSTIDALKRAGVDENVRWVRPEGIHVTLKFLGAVEPARVEAINTALRLGVRDVRSFDLRPDRLGTFSGFGGRGNLRVIWVDLRGDTQALAALAADVERALAPLGFPTESRAFHPHLTLARVQEGTSRINRALMSERIADTRLPALTMFHVKHLSLMQSTLGRGGATYRALSTFSLGAG